MDPITPADFFGRMQEKFSRLLFPNTPIELVMDEHDEEIRRISYTSEGQWVGDLTFKSLLNNEGLLIEKVCVGLQRALYKDIGWFLCTTYPQWLVEDLRQDWELWGRIEMENLRAAASMFDRTDYGDACEEFESPDFEDVEESFKFDLTVI